MAGRMISELNSASTLQNGDYIPLARGASTLKIDGLTLVQSITAVVGSGGSGGAVGGGSNRVFWENDSVVTQNYTITSGKNAGTFGPITLNGGVAVTVPGGSNWTIV